MTTCVCGKPLRVCKYGKVHRTCGAESCIRRRKVEGQKNRKCLPKNAPGLARMRLFAPEGMCPLCGIEPLKKSKWKKPWKTCGDEVCVRAYHRYWRRDQRAAERRERGQ